MTWSSDLVELTKREFVSLQRTNPRYSARAFARRLKISASTLSQILRGGTRWKLSVDMAKRLAERLDLSAAEKNRLLALMGVQPHIERQQVEDYEVLLNWRHSAIACSHNLPKEQRSPEAIGRRFSVDREAAEEIIRVLQRKGYLAKGKDGHLETRPIHWKAGDGPPSAVIRAHHRANLELAISAIEKIKMEERHFSSTTFVGDAGQLQELAQEIRNFHDRVMSLMDRGPQNNEVFRLGISLFPLRGQLEESES